MTQNGRKAVDWCGANHEVEYLEEWGCWEGMVLTPPELNEAVEAVGEGGSEHELGCLCWNDGGAGRVGDDGSCLSVCYWSARRRGWPVLVELVPASWFLTEKYSLGHNY